MNSNNQVTHYKINSSLCGKLLILTDGYSRIELSTTEEMIVDDMGLIHGGFIFSLADYAAMLAVNHPNVVLGAAEVRFIQPVRLFDKIIAEAKLERVESKKHYVNVEVKRNEIILFQGKFTCFTPKNHVLKRNDNVS